MCLTQHVSEEEGESLPLPKYRFIVGPADVMRLLKFALDLKILLQEMTKGGADVVIDAVGMDGKMSNLEFLASGLKLQGGTMSAFIIASQAVRKGGTIQVTGVYGGRYNGFPFGDIMQRNVNIRSGQAPVIHYMPYMYELVTSGKVDPGDIVTHVIPLSEAKRGYEVFDTKTDDCIKVVLKP